MLHLETVEPNTLGLLKRLMQLEALKTFDLVGRTALALQIGHRKSVDLDLFSPVDFTGEELIMKLSYLGKVEPSLIKSNTLLCHIEDVKVDFVKFTEPNLQALIEEEGIRMKGLQDIACMKLAALSARGAKKDFYDIYFLLQMFSLEEMLEWYKRKTGYNTVMHVIRSLAYFDDAELTETPVMLKPADWAEIKKVIVSHANKFIQ
ncbi:MAG: hypothetical protein JWO06_201 [Bacteroidota bacterium]|nr:hypothetical protein [Bacteroidota bacterium]